MRFVKDSGFFVLMVDSDVESLFFFGLVSLSLIYINNKNI